MKRIAACLALTACSSAGAAPSATPVNYNAFGFAALARLTAHSKTHNVFISPVSIGVALSMAADGAEGATRTQILRVLHVSGAHLDVQNEALIASFAGNTDASVGLANALWTREDIKPKAQYVKTLANSYGARAQALDFGNPSAAQQINSWTERHTLGLIDHIVDRTSASDFLYLTNALAFTAKWSEPFKKSATRDASFTNADGSKSTVRMMSQNGAFDTYDAKDYRVLRMPYGNGGYAAYILLPAGANEGQLVRQLNTAGFSRLARGLRRTFLHVELPRFTAEYGTSLVPLLQSLGMTDAFSSKADFSLIHSRPPSIAISSVQHASYLRIDEEGTTAAAATSVGMTMLAIQRPQEQFIVDHPFVLALRDERTGTLLFIGAIRTLKP